MNRQDTVLCLIVGILGVLSAAAAFAAESKKITADDVSSGYYYYSSSLQHCTHPSSPAFGLALLSATSLFLARLIICISTGCVCCRKGSSSKSTISCTYSFFSWLTFVIVFFVLIIGAAVNDEFDEDRTSLSQFSCRVVRPGVFSGTAIFSFLSVLFSIKYYITLKNTATTNNGSAGAPPPKQGGNIPVAQPQFNTHKEQLSPV